MAIVLCMNCGKPKPVPPWKSTRVTKVSTCPKCKPQPFRNYYRPTVKVIRFVSTLIEYTRRRT